MLQKIVSLLLFFACATFGVLVLFTAPNLDTYTFHALLAVADTGMLAGAALFLIAISY